MFFVSYVTFIRIIEGYLIDGFIGALSLSWYSRLEGVSSQVEMAR